MFERISKEIKKILLIQKDLIYTYQKDNSIYVWDIKVKNFLKIIILIFFIYIKSLEK